MSSFVMCCKLKCTTAAIGPYTALRDDTPVFSKLTISAISQPPSPVSSRELKLGAYQSWIGIKPPA